MATARAKRLSEPRMVDLGFAMARVGIFGDVMLVQPHERGEEGLLPACSIYVGVKEAERLWKVLGELFGEEGADPAIKVPDRLAWLVPGTKVKFWDPDLAWVAGTVVSEPRVLAGVWVVDVDTENGLMKFSPVAISVTKEE